MVLFPEHEELSASAMREGCAEVRDVFVSRPRRRLGVATALMRALELVSNPQQRAYLEGRLAEVTAP